jgi:hypothetical protein
VTNDTFTLTGTPPRVQQGLTYISGTNIVYDLMTGLVTANGPIEGSYYPTNTPAGTNAAGKTNPPAGPKPF